MKFDFPKVIREIDLTEYAAEYQAKVYVWVNPPRNTVTAFAEAVRNAVEQSDALINVLVELWSQGEDKWTADELRGFIDKCNDHAPKLFGWLVERTMQQIGEHRAGIKKKQPAQPS